MSAACTRQDKCGTRKRCNASTSLNVSASYLSASQTRSNCASISDSISPKNGAISLNAMRRPLPPSGIRRKMLHADFMTCGERGMVEICVGTALCHGIAWGRRVRAARGATRGGGQREDYTRAN